MRAVQCKAFGPPETLVVEDVEPAPLAPGQVRVAVHAASVNFPDTLIIQGLYQFKPELPFVPGSDAAGVVTEVAGDVDAVAVGDSVLAFSLHGAFAEELVVDARFVTPLPPGMSFDVAAAMLMTYGTSAHALMQRAALARGETLLVLGAAGGVGLAAVEIGAAMGARVIAAASSARKLEVAREHGAVEGIDYGTEDLKTRVRELTGGAGVDVVYDPVGGDVAEPALRTLRTNGRFLVVGFASGTIPRFPANLALLKECSIVGVFWGAFVRREIETQRRNMVQLFDWVAEGRLRPRIDQSVPLEDVGVALKRIIDREVTGKVVLQVR